MTITIIDAQDPFYPACPTCGEPVDNTLTAHHADGWSPSIGSCTFRYHPDCCPGEVCDSLQEPHRQRGE